MFFTASYHFQPDGALLVTAQSAAVQSDDDGTASVLTALSAVRPGARVILSVVNISNPDSILVAWMFSVARECAKRDLQLGTDGLPESIVRALKLALSVPERRGARRELTRDSFIVVVGRSTMGLVEDIRAWLSFVGELTMALGLFVRRKARVPVRDIWLTLDECGPGALPIVTLISTLVGVILAFIGAQQLRQFGAQIYVANLVSVAMLREMGAVMAGVIMAGRTGAAFAAQLGTMQVNEEIDALRTFGISPMQYLVVPRVLALIIMMPLLCLYADILGILGGAIVSALTMNISLMQYFHQAKTAVHLSDVWLGVFKSCVFGVLIAIAGCISGIRCGRSASAVGVAVTSAVVSGIVAIVLSDAIFAVLTEMVGL
jgi:phospholipid/cholesterol/gamma-HCH transport system permease protein